MANVRSAHEYIERKIGANTYTRENTVSVAGTPVQIVGANPRRVALLIIVLGSSSVIIGLFPGMGTNQGIRLSGSGGALTMTVDDDYDIVTHDFYAYSIGGAATDVYMLEEVIA